MALPTMSDEDFAELLVGIHQLSGREVIIVPNLHLTQEQADQLPDEEFAIIIGHGSDPADPLHATTVINIITRLENQAEAEQLLTETIKDLKGTNVHRQMLN